MNNKLILAIDGGTQSTKVSLFDIKGNEIAAHTVQLKELSLSNNGHAEHPEDDLWTSLITATNALFDKFQGDKSKIIGVGLGSIRCCRALVKADGSLAAPVQNWMDIRLSRPYEHENDEVKFVTTTTGYLSFRLTGETKDTRSNYVGPWPIDPLTLDWITDSEKFNAFNTPREMLFDLIDPSSVIGYVSSYASSMTGIPEALPVIATSNDKAVEGLGAGLKDDGSVLLSLGTYIAAMMVGKENILNSTNFWTNPGATPNEFLYESNGIRRGMSTVSWIKELLGSDLKNEAIEHGVSPEDYLNVLAKDLPVGCNGLYTVLNWLARPHMPHERGIIIGLNGTHKGPHLFRSVIEGIAMTMKNHVQAMCDELGIPLKQLVVSGGGSNGDLFMQILADVFNVPTHRNIINGSASLGAAICVALALKIYDNRDEAIDHMVKRRDSFYPNKANSELYNKINTEVYQHLASLNDEIMKKSYELFNN